MASNQFGSLSMIFQFNLMCKIPLSERSSTVKAKNNTRQWKKKYKIRNC